VKQKPKIVAIANQKGGVGKSTTADAFAGGLAATGSRVLLIDLDPQANITLSSGADTERTSVYEIITDRAAAQDAVQERTPTVDIIAASSDLALADIEIVKTGKEYRLREGIAPITANYDYIIIDTPPALGILTVNALTAANSVIIPAQADLYSVQGIAQLYETVKDIRAYTNPSLQILGILLTRYNSRSVVTRDMTANIEAAAQKIGTFVYKSVIRECVAIKEAQVCQSFICDHAPTSNACIDYQSFIQEFLKRSKK
jgi:chromosome partitioning protein